MSDITRVLKAAAVRLFVTRFIAAFVLYLTIAVVAAIALRIVEKMGIAAIDWTRVATYAPIGVALIALIDAAIRRPDRLAVARRVDEGAGLKEAISTALCVDRQQDGWSRSVVETASTAARAVKVGQAVPIQPPRHWPAPIVAGMALFVVWIAMPAMDVLGKQAEIAKKEEDQKKVTKAAQDAKDATAKVEQAMAKFEEKKPEAGKGDEAKIDKDKEIAGKSPEEIRRSAIKSLTDMKDRIAQAQKGEKAQTAEAMLEKLAQLRTPGNGPLSEMVNQLSKGDYAAAKEALEKLSKDLSSGEMSAADKAKLAEQLAKMAAQLEQIAKDRTSLENALQKAGLDKALAKDPQALADAMKKMDSLSPEAKQALQKMAEAMKNADNACKNMGQCMNTMAQACKNGNQGQQGQQGQQAQNGQQGQQGQEGQQGMSQEGAQAMQGLSDQLSQMEAAQQDLQSMQAAMSEANKQLSQMSESMGQCEQPGMGACQGGMAEGNGKFSEGDPDSNGMGRGGPGISQGGGGMGEKADKEKWEKLKVKGNDAGGPTISTMLIEGEQVKGESKAAFESLATAAEQEATNALENNVIERQYHDMVKHYFGRLAEKAKADGNKNAPAPKADAKDGKPAQDAPKK